jgi:hypothetical protein
MALREIALQADDVVRFLQPGTELAVQIRGQRDPDEMSAPTRAVVDSLENARAREPTMQGEARQKVVFSWVQPGETDAGDGDKAGLLGKHLDIAEGFE